MAVWTVITYVQKPYCQQFKKKFKTILQRCETSRRFHSFFCITYSFFICLKTESNLNNTYGDISDQYKLTWARQPP